METAPLDSQEDELTALRALVAEQAAKLESQEAEVIKRDSIMGFFVHNWSCFDIGSMAPLRKRSTRKIEQFELMLEEIEASRAEAELRSRENSSAGVGRRIREAEAQAPARWSRHRRTGLCGSLQLPDLRWHLVPEGGRQGGPGVGARAGVGQDCPACRKAHDLQGMRYDSGWRDADLAD
jgi:hypothetical protein